MLLFGSVHPPFIHLLHSSPAATFLSVCFCFSKTIQINIIDDEEYEKNKNFFLEMGEPQLLEMSERKGGGFTFPCCNPAPSNPAHDPNDL